ncbi:MAG TPA: choice-of-anchor N protein [Verrucomicrobiae bacterium]|nr:choice-of-anchor N protein [Verrucomicrobiae bacterium]
MRRFIILLGLGLSLTSSVIGVPVLSLDVGGGTYDSGSQTIIATSDPFTLYALFNTQQGKVSGTYYIAAAIVPKTQNPPLTDFGSFKVNGVTYSSANMAYGNPPASITEKSLDLQSHGIYDTHYVEIGFTFDTSRRADLYNSAENPGGPDADPTGAMIFEDFDVDVSGLAAGYQVHFDLYNLGRDKRGNTMVKEFAPFSKDAQSGPLSVADTSSTMILLGMAMLGIEGLRRRFAR